MVVSFFNVFYQDCHSDLERGYLSSYLAYQSRDGLRHDFCSACGSLPLDGHRRSPDCLPRADGLEQKSSDNITLLHAFPDLFYTDILLLLMDVDDVS